MPCEGNKPVRAEGVGIMTMAASGAEEFAANLAQATFKLPAIPGGILQVKPRARIYRETPEVLGVQFRATLRGAPWLPVENGESPHPGRVRGHDSRAAERIWRSIPHQNRGEVGLWKAERS